MFRKQIRNIIPNSKDNKKSKEAESNEKTFVVGDKNDCISFVISSTAKPKSKNMEKRQQLLEYKIKNLSQYEIDMELDFTDSSLITAQLYERFTPNKTLFRKHFDSFSGMKQKEGDNDTDTVCKVTYNKNYKVRAMFKFSMIFPSLDKQCSLIEKSHRMIEDMSLRWNWLNKGQVEAVLYFNRPPAPKSEKKEENVKAYTKFYSNLFDRDYFNDSDKETSNFFYVDTGFILGLKNKKLDFSEEVKSTSTGVGKDTQILKANLDTSDDEPRTIKLHLRRIQELNKNFEERYQIIEDNENFQEKIKFGLKKNLNVIFVFLHLSDNPEYIKRLFPENYINDLGIFKVNLFLNGGWLPVALDQFIPCFPMHFPLYTYSKNAYWPCLIEKALAKVFGGYEKLIYLSFYELYQVLTGLPIIDYRFSQNKDIAYENTELANKVSRVVSLDLLKNKITKLFPPDKKEQNSLMAFYFKVTNKKEKEEFRLFPIKSMNEGKFEVLETFALELHECMKKYLAGTECFFTWDTMVKLSKKVELHLILVNNSYNGEKHYRNAFIRCQDENNVDYERVLSYSYYKVKIPKECKVNKAKMTVCLNLSNDHKLDPFYFSKEIDWKITVLKEIIPEEKETKSMNDPKDKKKGGPKQTPRERDNQKKEKKVLSLETFEEIFENDKDLFIETNKEKNKDNLDDQTDKEMDKETKEGIFRKIADFSVGYGLVCNYELEPGNYIIIPMTTSFCMQRNEIYSKTTYNIDDKEAGAAALEDSIVSNFIDDLFYINDPLCYNYLNFETVSQISGQIVDSNGRRMRPIDKVSFESFLNFHSFEDDNSSKTREEYSTKIKGMTQTLFKMYMFERMRNSQKEQKKESLQNLGYDRTQYPYLAKFFSCSFYFNTMSDDKSLVELIKVTPRNNLKQKNMDNFANCLRVSKALEEGTAKYEGDIIYIKGSLAKTNCVQITSDLKGRVIKQDSDETTFYSTHCPIVSSFENNDKLYFLNYTIDDYADLKLEGDEKTVEEERERE
ncbi:MAG: C2 family cysteine protease, partial [archaeon]|nr:C2 family cysteine protease [archaeon]